MDAPAVVVRWLEDAGSVEGASKAWETCDAWLVALWLGVHAMNRGLWPLVESINTMCAPLASGGLAAREEVPSQGAPPHEHVARAHRLRAGAASLLAAAVSSEAAAHVLERAEACAKAQSLARTWPCASRRGSSCRACVGH